MSMVSMKPILKAAVEGKYAHGAFNVNAICQIEAVVRMHEILRSPLIIQAADLANGFMGGNADFMKSTIEDKRRGAKRIGDKVRALAERSVIPVCLHLDHGKDMDSIRAAIDGGFTSVMIDGSHLPYDENVAITKKVVDYAKGFGVSVEGELGVLAGVEDDVFSEKSTYTNPMLVCDFFEKTGVDCLAISYGTMHGPVKGKNVRLRKEIATASMENMRHSGIEGALVSHGSSIVPPQLVQDIINNGGELSDAGGIPLDQLKAVIPEGICKINIDTDLRLAATRNVREYFNRNPKQKENLNLKAIWDIMQSNPKIVDPRGWLVPMMDTVTAGVIPNDDIADIVGCIKDGISEIVATLIVEFGSSNKMHLVKA